MRKVLFVISGPSGVGKGTLVRALLEGDESLALSVSCTTRPPRPGEREGVDYYFVSRERFSELRKKDDFLECDEHFGNFYGTPKSYVFEQMKTKSVLLEIDVVGALKAREEAAKAGFAVVLIMIAPPSVEELERRILRRGAETDEQLKARRERALFELGNSAKYDYVVVNDDLAAAVRELKEIVNTEKNKE